MKVKLLDDQGAYLQLLTPAIAPSGAPMYPGVYTFDAFSIEIRGVFTNLTPTDAYRGAGRPEAAYAIERAIDALARKVDTEPAGGRGRHSCEDGAGAPGGAVRRRGGHRRPGPQAGHGPGRGAAPDLLRAVRRADRDPGRPTV